LEDCQFIINSFFAQLKTKAGIDLENLVYYRGETHYLVMTAKTESLVSKGVSKGNPQNVAELLAPDKVDKGKLESFVREVATYVGLPSSRPFELNPRGTADVAIFDFSKKQQAVTPFKLADEKSASPLLVILAGDALVEPFWPLGTGCNRAILAALDTAWITKTFMEREKPLDQLKQRWTADYRFLSAATETDIVANFGLHSIDPATRYKRSLK